MLRLSRAGSKKRPVYHLVAADRRARRDGRFIENLGYYMPTRDILMLKLDRVEHWKSVGAQMTDTAAALIKRAAKHGNTAPAPKAKPAVEAKPAPEAAAPAPAPAAEAKPAEAPKSDAAS